MSKGELTFTKFNVSDSCAIEGSKENINVYRFNQVSGPAYSAFLNGEIVACGGLRVLGVGEVWALYSPKLLIENPDERGSKFIISEERRQDVENIVRESNNWLNLMIRDESLWRVWSDYPKLKPNQKFLKHMGFEEVKAFVKS